MTNEQLEKANEIRSNIRTLKAECDSLAPDWKTGKKHTQAFKWKAKK